MQPVLDLLYNNASVIDYVFLWCEGMGFFEIVPDVYCLDDCYFTNRNGIVFIPVESIILPLQKSFYHSSAFNFSR